MVGKVGSTAPLSACLGREEAGWAVGFPASHHRFFIIGKALLDRLLQTPRSPTAPRTLQGGEDPPPNHPAPQCAQSPSGWKSPRRSPRAVNPAVLIKADGISEIIPCPLVGVGGLHVQQLARGPLCPLTRGVAQLGGDLRVHPPPIPAQPPPGSSPTLPISGVGKLAKTPEVTQSDRGPPLCPAPRSPQVLRLLAAAEGPTQESRGGVPELDRHPGRRERHQLLGARRERP